MDSKQWRERQIQDDWWQKQQEGGDSNSGDEERYGWLVVLLLIGMPIVLMLMFGCSPKLQENNTVKPVNFILPLPQEVVLLNLVHGNHYQLLL